MNEVAQRPTMSAKRQKFEELAAARTKRVIKHIRILAGMGGKGRYAYEFSPEDVDHIASAIEVELTQLRSKMISPGRQLDVEFDFR